jgi:pimeloyl-ACP methyl ester carboxylesterase
MQESFGVATGHDLDGTRSVSRDDRSTPPTSFDTVLRSFAGGAIFADQFGSGRPRVLALHGWQRSRHDFDAVFGPAAIEALAVDLPGFGASPPPATAWGTGEYAQNLEPVLAEMAPGALVVGHSFGGLVALRLAVRFPETITGLVLTGVPLFRPAGSCWPDGKGATDVSSAAGALEVRAGVSGSAREGSKAVRVT